MDIAPGDANYVAKASLTLPRDVQLAGVTPHAHYLCKDMKVTATLPDGSTKPLIWIKDWDFNWQNAYRYRTPIDLPKGTRIDLVYTFDNLSLIHISKFDLREALDAVLAGKPVLHPRTKTFGCAINPVK